jgi:hypothetical protein
VPHSDSVRGYFPHEYSVGVMAETGKDPGAMASQQFEPCGNSVEYDRGLKLAGNNSHG